MKQAPRLFVVLLALAGASPVLAQDRMSDWPEGSAMHTAYLMVERRDAAEAELQAKHSELVALADAHRSPYMGSRVPAALEAEHAAWLAYRPARCELFGALTGAGGTWPTTHALDCEAQLTEQRLADVSAALACVQALPADEHGFRQSECLASLTPSTARIGQE